MAEIQPENMKGTTLDIAAQNRARLKQLFPTVFTETRNEKEELTESIDFEKLKAELGTFSDTFESRRERYGMEWPGKKEALHLIQTLSSATLKPCRQESVNFDTTENLFIEGDNLEVLKLLQTSYYGKVKMIYIDPPYNTGKEFIYPDNFSESLETYLEYAGLIDGDGKKFSTNTANEGRFHTKWLNMMYPRLYLARNLLRDDGVIFISIDDNEVSNLRKLCDEVFGEENFVEYFSWVKTSTPPGLSNKSRKTIEYIICFEKFASNKKFKGELLDGGDQPLLNSGNSKRELRFPKEKVKFNNDAYYKAGIYDRVELKNDIEVENGYAKVDFVLSGEFKWIQTTLDDEIEKGTNFIIKSDKFAIRFIRNDEGGYKAPTNLIKEKYTSSLINKKENNVGTNEVASSELAGIFGAHFFDFPKPVNLIKHLINFCTSDNDIVLDFFAGSATTAHAVLDLNKQDNGNSKFILVQLPEPCAPESEAFKAGYKTIADIGKERIRRVINKLNTEEEGKLDLDNAVKLDRGFKVLKLDKSNFRQWQKLEPSALPERILEQLSLHIDHIDAKATPEELLYEILLKAGFTLTGNIETKTITGKELFSVSDGALLLCLEESVTKELIDAVIELNPQQFLCLDSAFHGNDQLKANAVQTFNAHNMQKEKHNQILFKTV